MHSKDRARCNNGVQHCAETVFFVLCMQNWQDATRSTLLQATERKRGGMGTIENLRLKRRPLHEEVVDQLRDRIVQGDLTPGARLNERVLCEQLGISRTPLREAIKVLATEGLVELLPNRGAIVTALKAETMADTLAVMGSLESLAGELACANASEGDLAEIRARSTSRCWRIMRGGRWQSTSAATSSSTSGSSKPRATRC